MSWLPAGKGIHAPRKGFQVINPRQGPHGIGAVVASQPGLMSKTKSVEDVEYW